MEWLYVGLFTALAALAAALELTRSRDGAAERHSKDFLRFRNNYVLVYMLMTAGDWLQGPYVYALYQHYGFDRGDIGRLFVAGFGSSMVFGTVVGSLADKLGRKRAALTYAVTYTLGCCTKHWSTFGVLFMGRILCGVATSLLHSAFESWLVAEHFKRGYDGGWLSGTFAKAVFLGNGLVAIVAGLLAHVLVEFGRLGPIAPFDAAAAVLAAGGALVALTWTENYGGASERRSFAAQLLSAAQDIARDERIALLGAMQSLFEGSMYTFVFLWTPALSPGGERLPHGMIFACFMVASMAGSAIAGRLMADPRHRVERYMQAVFVAAAAALFVPVVFRTSGASGALAGDAAAAGLAWQGKLQLLAFCVFEAAVGVFWPSMMAMRSQHLPEESRATIINFFRIPLNLFVCVVLYNVSSLPLTAMFGMCALFLLVCAACQRRLEHLVLADRPDAAAQHPSKVALLGKAGGGHSSPPPLKQSLSEDGLP